MNEAAYAISPRASAMGLPCSAVRIKARSSWFSTMISDQRRRMTERSDAVFARHRCQALFADSIARRVSTAPILGMVPMVSFVAGFVTGMVSPLSASVHSPLIKQSSWKSAGSFRCIIANLLNLQQSIKKNNILLRASVSLWPNFICMVFRMLYIGKKGAITLNLVSSPRSFLKNRPCRICPGKTCT